jgi:glycosyltransferase involved in cell wall biosynthesis
MAGGGQWSLYYLIKHLNKDLFHPIVLCPDKGELAEKMTSVGAEVLLLNFGRIRHFNPFVLWKLISIIRKCNTHIVHTDSTTETFYAGIAARIIRIPLVWHIRVSENSFFFNRLLSILSTKLILVGSVFASMFKWLKAGSKITVIHNAVDLEEFDSFSASPSLIRKERGVGDSEILLACIGRIEKRKGQAYLIDAMRHIDNAKLILIGKGEEKYLKHIKWLCEKYKLSDKIIFAGHRDNIPSLLRDIDIIVFPVIYGEGFSRVILEAMAAGKPVIATDVGGNPEAVIDEVTGYIVPAKDTKSLTKRISDLAKDKEKREKMGVAGREEVTKNYNIRKQVETIQNLYVSLLKKENG